MISSSLSPLGRNLITVFGLGAIRPAPGTFGSLPPVLLAALLMQLGLGPAHPFPATLIYHAVLILVLILFTAACITYGDAAEAHYHRKDPSHIVADETAGQCIPLLFLPAAAVDSPARALITLLAAFLAFRGFDIAKLPPANRLERAPGGWGVVLDDLVAGLQALILIQLATRLLF